MTRKEASIRPAKHIRDELRRDQILAAAKHCVVRHGFHMASMAQIAKQAQMSVGQLYRYFPSKETLIHAIVECIVNRRLAWLAGGGMHAELPAALALRKLDDSLADADDRALWLEVTAEATRNPAVAAIVRNADTLLHGQAVAALRQDHPHLGEQEARARVELMAVLYAGTLLREMMAQRADPAVLAALYEDVIEQLLPGRRRDGSTRK